MRNKPITIIIITYNSSKTILPLLKSLEIFPNLKLIEKVIIIENNSPDKIVTLRYIKKYKIKSSLKIQLITSKRNNGFAKSCNFGVTKANSEYVLFLNPDTTLQNNSLGILYQHAINANADIIGGISKKDGWVHETVVRHPNLFIGLFEFTNLGKIFGITKGHSDFYYEGKTSIYKSTTDVVVDAIGGAYLMVKRLSFKALKGFDVGFFMYLEDVDLGIRANHKNMTVLFCPHSVISHIGGASSMNKQHIRHEAWYDSRKYYFKKHYGFIINMLIQPIFVVEEVLLKTRHYLIELVSTS